MKSQHASGAASRQGLALLLALAVASGCEQAPSGQQVDEEQIRRLVSDALPQWDAALLEVAARDDWTARLDFARVFEAAGDRMPRLRDTVPDGATRFEAGETVVRLERERGRIRYVNRARAWDVEQSPQEPVEEARAQALVRRALETLGVPAGEVTPSRVATQVAAGAPAGSDTIVDRYDMYRIVDYSRTINALPVYGSSARAAIANDGVIQRLQVIWPTFRMAPRLALRQRDSVIEETVRRIVAQDPDPELRIEVVLAYAPRSLDDEEIAFVPVAVVSVYSAPTPYQMPIALVR